MKSVESLSKAMASRTNANTIQSASHTTAPKGINWPAQRQLNRTRLPNIQSQKTAVLTRTATSAGVIQQKGRIDLNKITDVNKKEEIKSIIETYKKQKRQEKLQATQIWIDRQTGDTDKEYNETITKIREDYENKIRELSKNLSPEAYVSGESYYGDKQVGIDTAVYKRADNGKEYVKDKRGTFVPRYIKRELNKNDKLPNGAEKLTPKAAISNYRELESSGKMPSKLDDIANKTVEISWEHKEFLQQSAGGGENQFLFSHSSTKRPILSNDHLGFGMYENGAILTDLSKLPENEIAAQWQINGKTGHKEELDRDAHVQIGEENSFKQRDEIVRMSGYRNMEVVTGSIPAEAIIKKPSDPRWEGADAEKSLKYTEALQQLRQIDNDLKNKKKDFENKEKDILKNSFSKATTKHGQIKRNKATIQNLKNKGKHNEAEILRNKNDQAEKDYNEMLIKLNLTERTEIDGSVTLNSLELNMLKEQLEVEEKSMTENKRKLEEYLKKLAYGSGMSTRGTLMKEQRIELEKSKNTL